MLPFGVTIPATVPQGSEIPEGLMNNPVYRPKSVRTEAEHFGVAVICIRDLPGYNTDCP
jgi:hypothetical protein